MRKHIAPVSSDRLTKSTPVGAKYPVQACFSVFINITVPELMPFTCGHSAAMDASVELPRMWTEKNKSPDTVRKKRTMSGLFHPGRIPNLGCGI